MEGLEIMADQGTKAELVEFDKARALKTMSTTQNSYKHSAMWSRRPSQKIDRPPQWNRETEQTNSMAVTEQK